jgi:hypothetical protein
MIAMITSGERDRVCVIAQTSCLIEGQELPLTIASQSRPIHALGNFPVELPQNFRVIDVLIPIARMRMPRRNYLFY